MSKIEPQYLELKQRLSKIAHLESILGFLEWDQQVFLPSGAHKFRASQTSAQTEIVHRLKSDPSLGELLHELDCQFETLNKEQQIVVSDALKSYHRVVRIPEKFAAKKAQKQSEAYQIWMESRETNSFSTFENCLQEQIDLCREEAALVGTHDSDSIYNFWLDTFDPGMDVDSVEALFKPLGEAIADMVPALVEAQQSLKKLPKLSFDVCKQETFLNEVVKRLGFDFTHGRIDKSVHPFCAGVGQDIRMTTRFFEDNPLDSLYSSIHEAGHAMYEQGLPKGEFGNAVGSYVGMAVHESQSRLWENQVARSEVFWDFWDGRYRELFADQMSDVTREQWMQKILEVKPILIRVDSDEVTYNLHIIIRFELEKALFDGSLNVSDLPSAWNELYKKYLGITPDSDKEGVLQDVHWATGAFGYFPSYTVGTILSAQLWDKIKETNPDIEQQIRQGEYSDILSWLRENVHQHGKRFDTKALTKHAVGCEISEQPLIDYLKSKYFGYFGI